MLVLIRSCVPTGLEHAVETKNFQSIHFVRHLAESFCFISMGLLFSVVERKEKTIYHFFFINNNLIYLVFTNENNLVGQQ